MNILGLLAITQNAQTCVNKMMFHIFFLFTESQTCLGKTVDWFSCHYQMEPQGKGSVLGVRQDYM